MFSSFGSSVLIQGDEVSGVWIEAYLVSTRHPGQHHGDSRLDFLILSFSGEGCVLHVGFGCCGQAFSSSWLRNALAVVITARPSTGAKASVRISASVKNASCA